MSSHGWELEKVESQTMTGFATVYPYRNISGFGHFVLWHTKKSIFCTESRHFSWEKVSSKPEFFCQKPNLLSKSIFDEEIFNQQSLGDSQTSKYSIFSIYAHFQWGASCSAGIKQYSSPDNFWQKDILSKSCSHRKAGLEAMSGDPEVQPPVQDRIINI